MDEGLVGIVEAGEPQRLATGFEFTEGPLWVPEGYWLFVDIRTSRIYKLVPGGEPEVVRENSDQSNGMTHDMQGRILVCEMESRQLNRWESDGSFTAMATHWDGKRLNRPNDVIVASNGDIYFTDPGLRMEPPENAVRGQDMLICAYDRHADGSVTNGRVFAEHRGPEGVPDGMKVDTEGRVFSTGPGGCWVFSPSGACRRSRPTAALAAMTSPLFFTARTSVYSVRVTTPGVRPPGNAI